MVAKSLNISNMLLTPLNEHFVNASSVSSIVDIIRFFKIYEWASDQRLNRSEGRYVHCVRPTYAILYIRAVQTTVLFTAHVYCFPQETMRSISHIQNRECLRKNAYSVVNCFEMINRRCFSFIYSRHSCQNKVWCHNGLGTAALPALYAFAT